MTKEEMKFKQKIFCIGLNKTGTTSLHKAFKILGLKSVHYEDTNGENIKSIIKTNHESGKKLLDKIEHYHAFSDWNLPSTNHLFKNLDKQYPNSYFILNTRDLKDWLNSREKHVKRKPFLKHLQRKSPSNSWINIDKEAWKNEYISHHRDVFEYFENRPNDLLVFDITKGDGWEKLCNFLQFPVPNRPFPKANVAKDQSISKKILLVLKRYIRP